VSGAKCAKCAAVCQPGINADGLEKKILESRTYEFLFCTGILAYKIAVCVRNSRCLAESALFVPIQAKPTAGQCHHQRLIKRSGLPHIQVYEQTYCIVVCKVRQLSVS